MTRVRHVLVALAGVLIGHEIVHAVPHDHANDAAHGYIPFAVMFVVPIGLLALVSLVRDGVAEGELDLRPTRIALLQVYLFGFQETAEALGTGSPVWQFLADPVLWLGILIQVGVVATIVAVLSAVRWLVACSPTIRSFALPTRNQAPPPAPPRPLSTPASNHLTRGPPVPAV